jgi:hypothetical protein
MSKGNNEQQTGQKGQTPTGWSGWLLALEKIGLKSLSTGNFGWFVLMVVALGMIWKLSSKDLRDVLVIVFHDLGWLGYPCAGGTVFVCVKTLSWREKFYQEEMNRNTEAKKVLVQKGFELQLQSTMPKP